MNLMKNVPCCKSYRLSSRFYDDIYSYNVFHVLFYNFVFVIRIFVTHISTNFLSTRHSINIRYNATRNNYSRLFYLKNTTNKLIKRKNKKDNAKVYCYK